jgi:hypothetical protein
LSIIQTIKSDLPTPIFVIAHSCGQTPRTSATQLGWFNIRREARQMLVLVVLPAMLLRRTERLHKAGYI